jgi:RimJ/RimL family protein N-acetyltransferase
VTDPTFRGDFLPFCKVGKKEAVREVRRMIRSGHPRFLGIEETSSHRLIGLLLYYGPQGFDYFEIGFYLEPSERGKGYGPVALKWLVGRIFERKRVETISAETSSMNTASQRALEKVGFKREGLLKNTLFRKGKWEDTVIYVLCRSEQSTS